MATLLAPNAAAFRQFISSDGSLYTSDANGVISNVTQGDILNMLNMGCTFLSINLTGKNNLTATTAPTTTDDSADGYAAGSVWLDVTNKNVYVCYDNTASAAVWGAMYTPGVVNVTTATLAVTAAAHAGKLVTLNRAAGITATLPAATGTGNPYFFQIGTTVTSNSTIIKVANGTDIIQGSASQTGATGAATRFVSGASDDTITLNGSTLGGFIGDFVKVTDSAAGVFMVEVSTKITGSAATPFSATV